MTTYIPGDGEIPGLASASSQVGWGLERNVWSSIGLEEKETITISKCSKGWPYPKPTETSCKESNNIGVYCIKNNCNNNKYFLADKCAIKNKKRITATYLGRCSGELALTKTVDTLHSELM